jgi:hypothetical protein
MREPTTEAQALAWYHQALNDKALHLEPTIDFEAPQCGWFDTGVSRKGISVPARIWLEQEVCPETGSLLSDEVLRCEVDGRLVDPAAAWIWLASNPITEERYNYLVARGEYVRRYAPEDPAATPFKPVDWLKVPTPTFNQKEAAL